MNWLKRMFRKHPSEKEDIDKTDNVTECIIDIKSDLSIESKTVLIDYFLEKYRTIILSTEEFEDILKKISDAKFFNGVKYAKISIDIINRLEVALHEEEIERNRLNECATLNNKGSELESNGDISEAIKVYEQNIDGDCYPASFSFDRLIVLYRKNNDIENEKRIINKAIEVLSKKNPNNVLGYKGRLNAIENPNPIYPTSAALHIPEGDTLGGKLELLKEKMPEFMFYSTENEPLEFPEPLYSSICDIEEQFKKMMTEAIYQEESNRYDLAANLYEKMIGEGYSFSKPYERLLIIYKKAKLNNDVIRVLSKGIEFFSNLRLKQYEYVNSLAIKYGKVEFWNERVKNKKKITYYLGAYELYNPYPCVEKFEEKLKKIQDKD